MEVEVEGNHPFLFLPRSKGRNHEATSPGIPKSSILSHFCSMGDKVPAGWEARPLHAVSGWKGNRASWNVVSGRQLQDHTVPWPRLTDKEPEAPSSVTRPRSRDWLVAASGTQ